jgi:two-component system CheB/CheR fusion protein
MLQCGIHDADSYYVYLRSHQVELHKLFQSFLIPVTNFFRNPKLFKALKAEIFPAILSRAMQKGSLRIWVPGCSTGEEVYSIAICLAEELNHFNPLEIRIFGTDVNEEAIEEGRKGFYSEHRIKGVTKQRLKKFFVKKEGGYKVSESIRTNCIFAPHNLLKDPPFTRLDIISCQNVLIYFTFNAQAPILDLFQFALKPEGFLLLGESEAISTYKRGFRKWKRGYPIYVPDHQ